MHARPQAASKPGFTFFQSSCCCCYSPGKDVTGGGGRQAEYSPPCSMIYAALDPPSCNLIFKGTFLGFRKPLSLSIKPSFQDCSKCAWKKSAIRNPNLSYDPFVLGKTWVLPEENTRYSSDVWEGTGQHGSEGVEKISDNLKTQSYFVALSSLLSYKS